MADTYELDPAVRVEEILNGDDIDPANRLEYFLKKAANEVPKAVSGSDGDYLTVNTGEYQLENPADYALAAVPPMVMIALDNTNTLHVQPSQNFYPCAALLGCNYDSSGRRVRVYRVSCASTRKTVKLKIYRIPVPGIVTDELTIDNPNTILPTYDLPVSQYGYTTGGVFNINNVDTNSYVTYRIAVEEVDADDNRIGDLMYSAQIVYFVSSDGVASIYQVLHFDGSYSDAGKRHITYIYLGKYTTGSNYTEQPLATDHNLAETGPLEANTRYTVDQMITPKAGYIHEFNFYTYGGD